MPGIQDTIKKNKTKSFNYSGAMDLVKELKQSVENYEKTSTGKMNKISTILKFDRSEREKFNKGVTQATLTVSPLNYPLFIEFSSDSCDDIIKQFEKYCVYA